MPRKIKIIEEPIIIPPQPEPTPIVEGQMEGGELFPKRKPGIFPPRSRKLLAKVGDEKITSLSIERSPISVGRAINWLTWGLYDKKVQETQFPHDKLFHLRLIINGKYILEKNQVLNFQPLEKVALKETLQLKLPPGFDRTINEAIELTRKYMGDKAFSDYHPIHQNCQMFVKSFLKANGLLTKERHDFTVQNVKSFFDKFPKFVGRLVRKITNAAARIDRLVEGEGKKKKIMETTTS